MHYNPASYRIELPQEVLNNLPLKQININMLLELMRNADYNPICYYNDKIVLAENEMAHDLSYRYILKDE